MSGAAYGCGPRASKRNAFSHALVALLLAGCPGSLENKERFLSDAALACSEPVDVPTEVFKQDCNNAICHDSEQPAGGLDLESPGVLGRLVGVPGTECTGQLRIVPADPDRSLLVDKLAAESPRCGDRMPFGNPLPPSVGECIRQWVHLVARTEVDSGLVDASADGERPGSGGGDAQ
jgi:hypothetical protein